MAAFNTTEELLKMDVRKAVLAYDKAKKDLEFVERKLADHYKSVGRRGYNE